MISTKICITNFHEKYKTLSRTCLNIFAKAWPWSSFAFYIVPTINVSSHIPVVRNTVVFILVIRGRLISYLLIDIPMKRLWRKFDWFYYKTLFHLQQWDSWVHPIEILVLANRTSDDSEDRFRRFQWRLQCFLNCWGFETILKKRLLLKL